MAQNDAFDLSLSRAEVSERSFLSQVYFWMKMGLVLTGLVAWQTAATPALIVGLMRNPFLMLVLVIAQLGLVFWLSAAALSVSVTTATVGFSIYATLNGILFSAIFLVYSGASIASTFFVTAGMFGAVSLYGFTTKQSLAS